MTLSAAETLDVSVLVPAKDEAANLPEFLRLCAEALGPAGFSFEVVVVNDGSRDDSAKRAARARAHAPVSPGGHPSAAARHRRRAPFRGRRRPRRRLRLLPRRPAIPSRGHSEAGGADPEGRADIVTGTKQGKYEKAFVSAVYNTLCRWLFGIRVTDLNSVKAYRREVMDGIALRPDWHRYMVVIAAADGFRLDSLPVPLYPRRAGVSKFTWRRIPVGIFDLLSVWFQLRFGRKPMLFFGIAGATLFVIGLIAGIVALVLRFGYGFGFRPLLNLVETMVICGIVLFGFGLLGEMVAGLQEETRAVARALDRLDKPDLRD